MRRALALFSFVVAACGGSTPPPAPLVVHDQDPSAAPAPAMATREAGAPTGEPASAEVVALRKCAEPGLRDALSATIERTKKGPIADRALVDALWSCFSRFRPSQAGSSISVVRDLVATVLAVEDPSYGPKAIEMIETPVADPHDASENMDQIQFWQLTSIRLLGELRHAPAARPLVQLLLDEKKKPLMFPVRVALARMPKESEPLLVAALNGTDIELGQLGSKSPDRAFVPRIADSLAAVGRPAGRDAILDALSKATNDSNRVLLATYLTRFPATPRTLKAYQEACAKIPYQATVPMLGGANGRASLVGVAAGFYDPTLVPFVLRENATAKGDAADAMTATALPAAIKLMMPEHAKAVAAEVNKIPGKAIEKDMYAAALAPLETCKKDVPCWLKELGKPLSSTIPATKMGHVKAAWMVAMLGQQQHRPELYKLMTTITDGSVRLALIEAIDHLSPNGDAAMADDIEKFVEQQKANGLQAGLDEMFRLALELRARTL